MSVCTKYELDQHRSEEVDDAHLITPTREARHDRVFESLYPALACAPLRITFGISSLFWYHPFREYSRSRFFPRNFFQSTKRIVIFQR